MTPFLLSSEDIDRAVETTAREGAKAKATPEIEQLVSEGKLKEALSKLDHNSLQQQNPELVAAFETIRNSANFKKYVMMAALTALELGPEELPHVISAIGAKMLMVGYQAAQNQKAGINPAMVGAAGAA